MIRYHALALALAMGLSPTLAHAQDSAAIAREHSAQGRTGDAIAAMRAHLAANPGDASARKDLARYLTWVGDYAAAQDSLDALAADDADAATLRANLLAWAGRIDAARELNRVPEARDESAVLPVYTQALIERQGMQVDPAWPWVQRFEGLRPDSKDAKDLRRGTRVLDADFITLPWSFGEDSIDMQHEQRSLRAQFASSDDWRWGVEGGEGIHRSPLLSAFAPVSGGREARHRWAMLTAQFTPDDTHRLRLQLGRSNLRGGDEASIGSLRWDWRVSDDWRFAAQADRARVDVSPRSLSLGLLRNQALLEARYTPDLRWTFDGSFSRQSLSDGNDRDEWVIAGRRAVLRRERVQLDLGVATQWLSFDADPGNGYYAPQRYRRLSLTAHAYFPISDDIGIATQAGVGIQRDENFSDWESANDLSVEAVFGIFSDWELRLRGAYSDRAQPAGVYEARTWGLQLTRRF